MTLRRTLSLLGALMALGVVVPAGASAQAPANPCTAPVTNPVACENTKAGTPESVWGIDGSGDDTIQGYATAISVNKGDPVSFKIKSAGAVHDRHLPPRLLQRRRRPPDGEQRDPLRSADAARVPGDQRHRPHRLRQLEHLGDLDRPVDCGLGALHRLPEAQRHGRRQPDHVRGARRLEPLRRDAPDLRRDLAGLQPLRRQQSLQLHRRLPDRLRRRLPGRVRGLLQPAVRHRRLERALVVALGRVPDDPLPRGQRLRPQLLVRHRQRDARQPAQQPQGVRLERPRRVLDADAARQRRGGARQRPQPRLLQRQRGVLEDPPRHERVQPGRQPDADQLQGHALPGP